MKAKRKTKPLEPLLDDQMFILAVEEFAKDNPGVRIEYEDPRRQALADATIKRIARRHK